VSRLPGNPRARLRARIQESFFARRTRWRASRPVYSITFDDAPASAGDTGARLVEEAGGRATFYVAGRWVLDGREAGFLDLDDLRGLAARGHQIACHSYTHAGLRGQGAEGLCWDTARNRLLLADAVGDAAVEDFAWPYGEASLRAKRHLLHSYRSLRTTHPGIHSGRFDVGALRSVALYGPEFSREAILLWIERAAARCGWLVFHTHGVEAQPDGNGTRCEDLTWVLNECSARGELCTLREARSR
jgi:peptidoglycan/xylan/chitin deacetylase (PgdA/CDA1 family)